MKTITKSNRPILLAAAALVVVAAAALCRLEIHPRHHAQGLRTGLLAHPGLVDLHAGGAGSRLGETC